MEKAKCPKCSSTQIEVVTEGKTKGFSCWKSLIGIFWWPFYLCGLHGAGKGKTTAKRMCLKCGKKF